MEPYSKHSSFVNLPNYHITTHFLQRKIIPLINDSSVVCDAGSGSWNRMLGSRIAIHVIGVDIEFDRIKSNNIINFKVVGDIQKQNFRNEVFDLIISNDVVEHLSDPEKFIKVCYRMLKNSGHIAIAAPNRNSLFGILAAKIPSNINQLLWKIIYGHKNINEVHFYKLNTEYSLRKILTINGFSNIDITYLNKLGDHTIDKIFWGWYYQLCKMTLLRKFSPGIFCIAQKFS